VQYTGHWHDAYIRKDPETGTLIICPGDTHIMACEREGKKVKKIHIYRLPKKKRAYAAAA
jgi:hypothetical protein